MAWIVFAAVVGVVLVVVSVLFSRDELFLAAAFLVYAVCLARIAGAATGLDEAGNVVGLTLLGTAVVGYIAVNAYHDYQQTTELARERDLMIRDALLGTANNDAAADAAGTVTADNGGSDDLGIDLGLMSPDDREAFDELRARLGK